MKSYADGLLAAAEICDALANKFYGNSKDCADSIRALARAEQNADTQNATRGIVVDDTQPETSKGHSVVSAPSKERELRQLAEQHVGRADDCGALARNVIALLAAPAVESTAAQAELAQTVFDNWSAYLRPIDREDFRRQLESIAAPQAEMVADAPEIPMWLVQHKDVWFAAYTREKMAQCYASGFSNPDHVKIIPGKFIQTAAAAPAAGEKE